MRQTFQTELRELQTQMAALGSLCADAIAKAVHAFFYTTYYENVKRQIL